MVESTIATATPSAQGPFRTDGRRVDRHPRAQLDDRLTAAWATLTEVLGCNCVAEASAACAASSWSSCSGICPCHRGGRR